MKKGIILGIGAVLLIVLVFVANVAVNKKDEDELLKGTYKIEISVKDYGKITANLYADVAPITVTHFVELVKDKYYDGLKFHRIMKGFMIQGGAPKSIDTMPSKIKGEFSANGVENNISHVRGTLSMARAGSDYDSASGQFFIVHEDSQNIDGLYAAFGRVESGMDVVDKIADVEVIDANGTVEESKRPVIEYIRLIEE